MIIRKYIHELDIVQFIKDHIGQKIKTNLDDNNHMSSDYIEGILSDNGRTLRGGINKRGVHLEGIWNIDLYSDDEDAWVEFEDDEKHNLTEHEFSSNEVLT